MANKKGGGGHNQPHTSGESSSIELDLQAYRDETNASMGELRSTMNTYQASFNSFKLEMMEEMRAMRELSTSAAAKLKSSLLCFGTMPPTLGIAAATQGQVTSALERAHEHAAHGLAITDPVPSLSTSSAKQTLQIQEITEVETSEGEPFFLNQTEPLVTNAAGAFLPKSGSSSSTKKGKTTTGSASSSKGNQHQQHIFQHTNFGTNPFTI